MEIVHTEAQGFLDRLSGDRPAQWEAIGAIWHLSRYVTAAGDDGDTTMEASFHDGSRLALLMTAEGELYWLAARGDQDGDLDVAALRDQVEAMAAAD